MSEYITVTDHRTGTTADIPVVDGGVDAAAWRTALPGLWYHDPGLMSTAICDSSITLADGERGELRYRGYDIVELAERSTYLEVAYLLIYGELPNEAQLTTWLHDVRYHTYIHENVRKRFLEGFHYDAHPMGMLVSAFAALSTFYPEAKDVHDEENQDLQIARIIGKAPTLAAACYRFSRGLPFVYPDNRLEFAPNFLSMMWKVAEERYEANPVISRALEVLLILHADHEQNCGTTVMRTVGSAFADPYSCVAAATAALYGPRHGGANEAVIRMLDEIGSMDRVDEYVRRAKSGEIVLQGFGHRIYKNYDPRASIMKGVAEEVFAVTGRNPKLDIALKLEEIALADPYFVDRRLYPNVDYYSGLILEAIGFPREIFTVLFAIPRVSGWLAHWREMLHEPNPKIIRPKQIYDGAPLRPFVPLAERATVPDPIATAEELR